MITAQLDRSQYSINSVVSRDAWSHAAAVSGWDHEYTQNAPGPFSALSQVAWLGPIQLIYEHIDQPINYRGCAWRGSRVFFSYLRGSRDMYFDNRPVSTDVLTTYRWDDVEQVSCSGEIAQATVAVNEQYFEQYVAPLPGFETLLKGGRAPVSFPGGSTGSEQFANTIRTTLADLSARPELLTIPQTRELLQRRVMESIFEAIADAQPEPTRLPPPSTRAFVVGRALDYIEAHIADPISIRDICAGVRVCRRTLSYAFAEVLDATPKSVMLASRLAKVHRDLADKGVQGSIQTIAMRWGFIHMGRFAQYYRKAFGERPSDTYQRRFGLRAPATEISKAF